MEKGKQLKTQNSAEKNMVMALGFVLFLSGVICNQWVLSAFTYDGKIDGKISLLIVYMIQALLILSGVLVIRARNSIRFQQKWGAGLVRYSPFTNIILICLLSYLLLEQFSFLAFHKVLPEEKRDTAFYTLGLQRGSKDLTPIFKPYVWSNYIPNPDSKQCSPYGWRYGGGPKTSKLRILCLGGSTTFSSEVEGPEESYPAQLERHLHSLGYDVDVINGGASYYTSAEVLGCMAFRGIYVTPDIVLIHTGGNDVEPLLALNEYMPDYTHWRTVGMTSGLSRDTKFKAAWYVPSWTWRLLAYINFRPDGSSRHAVATQLTTVYQNLYAENDIGSRYASGLESNLRSTIAIVRSIGAEPVVLLFKMLTDHPNNWIVNNYTEDEKERARAKGRLAKATAHSNEVMLSVAQEMNVPVIPFNEFEPSSQELWVDHCHLNAEGCGEKAEFIARYLIRAKLLEKARNN